MAFERCIERFTSEKDAIDIITSFIIKGTDLPNLGFFHSLLFDPVDLDDTDDYRGFYLATNVSRKELNLRRNGSNIVPGDIDILFIPYSDTQIYYNRAACFEVKIVRPHGKHPNKPSKSLGTQQVLGLIEDGFPLIGLIQICTSTPLTEDQSIDIPFCKVPANGPPINRPLTSDDFIMVKADWLPGFCIDNQMKRMIRSGLPKYIAMNAFGINYGEDGIPIVTLTNFFRGFNSGYFNPTTSGDTIKCIEKHFSKFSYKYRKLEIFPRV